MNGFLIRKKFRFEAAHILRVAAVSAECQENIHGHSYVVEIFLWRKELVNGMVLDFGILSDIVKPILREWDHSLILDSNDARFEDIEDGVPLGKIIYLEANPTAEEMARHLFSRITKALPMLATVGQNPVVLVKVRVHETETGWAEYANRM